MNQAAKKFDRDSSVLDRSFSLRAFNAYETEINEHYWSFQVISDYAGHIARGYRTTNPDFATQNAFHATGPDARRIPPTVSGWLLAQNELENWLRLSALVSAVAYHEGYLRQIIRCALMSRPLSRHGQPQLLDGVLLLKQGIEWPYDEAIEASTRGEWPQRKAGFAKLFGSPPAGCFPLRELEAMRKLRNDYAHGFGRDVAPPTPTDGSTPQTSRLSKTRLIEYVGLLSKSAAAIDAYLLSNFVGGYELLYAYHVWKSKSRPKQDRSYGEGRAFQRHLHRDLSLSISTEYCVELIAYYRKV